MDGVVEPWISPMDGGNRLTRIGARVSAHFIPEIAFDIRRKKEWSCAYVEHETDNCDVREWWDKVP